MRYNAPVSAEAMPPLNSSSHIPMLAEDISEGGLRVSCNHFVPRRSRLLVTLHRNEPNGTIRIEGTVVRVQQVDRQERWNIGLAFDEQSAAGRTQIRELLTGPIRP